MDRKYFIDDNIMTTEYAQMLASLLWVVILAGRLTCAYLGDKISKNITTNNKRWYCNLLFVIIVITEYNHHYHCYYGLRFFNGRDLSNYHIYRWGTIKKYPMSMGILLMLGGIGSIIMPTMIGALADNLGIFAGMSAIVFAIVMMMILY